MGTGSVTDGRTAAPVDGPAAPGAQGAAPSRPDGPGRDPAPADGGRYASVYPGPGHPVDQAFADAVDRLETALGVPVWLLVQPPGQPLDHHPFALLDEPVRHGLLLSRHELRAGGEVALVVDSPGGSARTAYQVARALRRHCGGFTAVVPRYAKSAATLLVLGADRLYMGLDAELGPLDAQLFDVDKEEAWTSALDEVQALDRLNVAALEQVDQTMTLLAGGTGKKLDTLLPHALRYTADMMRPLLERIDTVHYIRQSRVLKVAEDYATRLLEPRYGTRASQEVAAHLVNGYPEHAFVIDREEAAGFLGIAGADPAVDAAVEALADILERGTVTAVGRLRRTQEDPGEG